jgi:ABC-type nitrate/sulfonate/bicarbonate transport system substrate-binding protein
LPEHGGRISGRRSGGYFEEDATMEPTDIKWQLRRRAVLKGMGALALAPIIASTAAGRAQAAAAIQPIRFGLQNTFTGAAAVVWARQHVYRKRHLNVQAYKFADGRGVRNAMLAGKVDFGTMNLTPFLVGAGAGNFVLIGFVLLGGDTIGLMANNDIRKVGDLKGKNVSITVGSTTGGIFTDNVGPKFGLNKDDYRIVNLPPQDQLSGLASGSIAAFAGPEPYLTLGTEQKLGHVLLRFGKYDPNPTCLVVNASFLDKHPETVVAFLRSWLDGVKYWHDDPKGVVQALHSMYQEDGYTTLTPAMIAKIVKLPKVEPEITPDLVKYIKGQAQRLHDKNRLPALPGWNKAIRPDLLKKAKART